MQCCHGNFKQRKRSFHCYNSVIDGSMCLHNCCVGICICIFTDALYSHSSNHSLLSSIYATYAVLFVLEGLIRRYFLSDLFQAIMLRKVVSSTLQQALTLGVLAAKRKNLAFVLRRVLPLNHGRSASGYPLFVSRAWSFLHQQVLNGIGSTLFTMNKIYYA